MAEALVEHVQTYSVQKDASMSDVFEALILAAYEAREELDLRRIRARGRWGTPTAAAFRIALKNAFQRAVGDHIAKQR
jgi:hypothetical protein